MSETDVSGSPETPEGAARAAGATPPPAQPPSPADTGDSATDAGGAPAGTAGGESTGDGTPRKRRRRGSRGGRKRSKPRAEGAEGGDDSHDDDAGDGAAAPAGERANGRAPAGGGSTAKGAQAGGKPGDGQARGAGANRARGRGRTRAAGAAGDKAGGDDDRNPELPDLHREGRPSAEAGAKATVAKAPKPKIGDTIPADVLRQMEGRKPDEGEGGQGDEDGEGRKRRRRRGGRGRSGGNKGGDRSGGENRGGNGGGDKAGGQRSGGRRRGAHKPVEAVIAHSPTELDEETLERRRGRERKGRAVGRYSMCVHVSDRATQIAVLEGRSLIEHYVSHPSDDVSQIHGNVYIGRVQNVLPGMEAAFVDIGTPKNAVLYRGDVHYDPEDVERSSSGGRPRIEEVLRAGQTILCQVTKNPIGAKGARLTQEVSLPGRFVVLIPNSSTYGISKRLPDEERKRLRTILDRVKPAQHGVIVRTAAENVTTEEIEDDVDRKSVVSGKSV